jgi:predicted DNA-binding protein
MAVSAEDRAVSVRLPVELYEQLRRFAFDQRITQVEVIREALRRFLEQESGS